MRWWNILGNNKTHMLPREGLPFEGCGQPPQASSCLFRRPRALHPAGQKICRLYIKMCIIKDFQWHQQVNEKLLDWARKWARTISVFSWKSFFKKAYFLSFLRMPLQLLLALVLLPFPLRFHQQRDQGHRHHPPLLLPPERKRWFLRKVCVHSDINKRISTNIASRQTAIN